MADQTPKPLTVAEIVSFQVPPRLAGWKLTPDVNGGYSFRAKIDGISYIATPEAWEGRTLSETAAMGQATNFGLNLNQLRHQVADTITTNSGTYRPAGAEGVPLNGVAACPPSGPCEPATSYDNLLLPGAIVVAAVAYYFAGKRKA